MDMHSVIQKFRSEYAGPSAYFFITGGGHSCLDFRRYPGASRILRGAYEPYVSEEIAHFMNEYGPSGDLIDPSNFSFCTEQMTVDALQALSTFVADSTGSLLVVVNSALTTNRWRRGDNRSWIATSRGNLFRLNLNKIDEQNYNALTSANPLLIDSIRESEDMRVGQVVLAIVMNDPSMMPRLEVGETLDIVQRNDIFCNQPNQFAPANVVN
jgi:hypothetical protein